jgi:hypothetical protein
MAEVLLCLPSYDQQAAALLTQRVLDVLAKVH